MVMALVMLDTSCYHEHHAGLQPAPAERTEKAHSMTNEHNHDESDAEIESARSSLTVGVIAIILFVAMQRNLIAIADEIEENLEGFVVPDGKTDDEHAADPETMRLVHLILKDHDQPEVEQMLHRAKNGLGWIMSMQEAERHVGDMMIGRALSFRPRPTLAENPRPWDAPEAPPKTISSDFDPSLLLGRSLEETFSTIINPDRDQDQSESEAIGDLVNQRIEAVRPDHHLPHHLRACVGVVAASATSVADLDQLIGHVADYLERFRDVDLMLRIGRTIGSWTKVFTGAFDDALMARLTLLSHSVEIVPLGGQEIRYQIHGEYLCIHVQAVMGESGAIVLPIIIEDDGDDGGCHHGDDGGDGGGDGDGDHASPSGIQTA